FICIFPHNSNLSLCSCLLNHLLRKLVFPDPDCPPSKKAVGDSTAFLLEPILLNYHLSDSQTVCQ
ncbi:hypothetical protein, partial [Coprococcus intestinihominis]|uniref:hypothetical protein n=1 Tax=Coprococcus intestinihominis TaxID=3133154 RepID=UPI003F4967DA